MASEGKLECLLSLSVLWAEQLSKTTFFPSPDVPEEDANEHILMLQNCQILFKEPNRMPLSPVSLLSNGEYLYCYQSYKQKVHNKIYAVFLF